MKFLVYYFLKFFTKSKFFRNSKESFIQLFMVQGKHCTLPGEGVQLISLNKNKDSMEKITEPMAHDLTLIDQEACFSLQMAFIDR
ncbi:MAG: hypothetical protein ACOCQG_04355 [Candidatus Nanoarchaeia archaeon]